MNDGELESILLSVINGDEIDNAELKKRFNNADAWQDKLLCLTYSFSKILERHPVQASQMILKLFSLPDTMLIEIQECDEKFVEYMLQHFYPLGSELEESLVIVARDLSEHRYDQRTICN